MPAALVERPGRAVRPPLADLGPEPLSNAFNAAEMAERFAGKKAPWDAFWGQRYACVLDPDGNQIDLFAQIVNG